mmetsp:Transcript_2037/g.2905  ORF Transcript_2037/g.2905 Transcript_2037/m.2905 type:complete len:192 (+) Transcript_2037:300-875(+)
MFNLYRYEQELLSVQSAKRAATLQKRDKNLRKKLAKSYALRVNKWMHENTIDDYPDTYREYHHDFRNTDKGRHLGLDRVSSLHYENERDRIRRNVGFQRSQILNVHDGNEVYTEAKTIFRHRFPTKEMPSRPRFQTRFTDTTEKLHRVIVTTFTTFTTADLPRPLRILPLFPISYHTFDISIILNRRCSTI